MLHYFILKEKEDKSHDKQEKLQQHKKLPFFFL